jgi:hypothetical protein
MPGGIAKRLSDRHALMGCLVAFRARWDEIARSQPPHKSNGNADDRHSPGPSRRERRGR